MCVCNKPERLQHVVVSVGSPGTGRARQAKQAEGGSQPRDESPHSEKMTALALTCISADSEAGPARVFVSQCAGFILDSLQKLICLGHLGKPPQTFGGGGWTSSSQAVSFKSAYFHLISQQYETGSF